MSIYLDYSATTPAHPEVVKAMMPYFARDFGNPSSIHSCGQETRLAVETARVKVARLIGARSEEVVFTSGGTEADNLALKGVALAREAKGNHIITARIEHHAVLETCRFLEGRGLRVTYLGVDGYGLVDPEDVRRAITDKTILISVMYANNEVGTLEPIADIGKIARQAGVYFHTDAVQAVGHIPVAVSELGVDLLSISAHKLYGPKGIGALYIRKGTALMPTMHGGGQERGLRSSTENVPAIVGLGKAAEIALEEMPQEAEQLTRLRDKLITGILEGIGGTRLNGHPSKRLPNNANIGFDGVEGEAACINLSLIDICASAGSACSSSSVEPSHVLLALGRPREQAHNSLRFSLGKWTTESEIGRVLEVLPRVIARLRAQ
jgi:cysteine desulfurase